MNLSIDERLDSIARELISGGITRDEAMEAFERKYLATAVSICRGNKTRAAQKAGVHRNTLMTRMRVLCPNPARELYLARLRARRSR